MRTHEALRRPWEELATRGRQRVLIDKVLPHGRRHHRPKSRPAWPLRANDAADRLLHLVEGLHRVVAAPEHAELPSSRLELVVEAGDREEGEGARGERALRV